MPKLCLLDLDDPIPLAPLGIEKRIDPNIFTTTTTLLLCMQTNCFKKESDVRVLTLSKYEENVSKGSKGDGNAHDENYPFPVRHFGCFLT